MAQAHRQGGSGGHGQGRGQGDALAGGQVWLQGGAHAQRDRRLRAARHRRRHFPLPAFVSERVIRRKEGEGRRKHQHRHTACNISKQQNARDPRTNHQNPRASLRSKARADRGPQNMRSNHGTHRTEKKRKEKHGNPTPKPKPP